MCQKVTCLLVMAQHHDNVSTGTHDLCVGPCGLTSCLLQHCKGYSCTWGGMLLARLLIDGSTISRVFLFRDVYMCAGLGQPEPAVLEDAGGA